MSAEPLPSEALLDVKVRLSAELGRARMPLASVVGLGDGAIVDLDRTPEDPMEVFANGRLVGKGRLLLVDGEWALRLESIDFRDGSLREDSASGSGLPDDHTGQ